MQEEIWKDIEGYEGLYKISNYGRVKSFYGKRGKSVRILKPSSAGSGYSQVHLWKDGEMSRVYIHRLVANSFIPNPENKPEVNHRDEDKRNNYFENLEWSTREENVNWGTAIERGISTQGNSVEQYSLEGKLINTFLSVRKADKETGINQSSIVKVCLGKQATAGGYKWRYVKKSLTNVTQTS